MIVYRFVGQMMVQSWLRNVVKRNRGSGGSVTTGPRGPDCRIVRLVRSLQPLAAYDK